MYHYAGNIPIQYTDPDERETTVFNIHANKSWEKLVNGSHVAIYFSKPGTDRYGDYYTSTLYAPSGSYDGGVEGCVRTPSGIFSEEKTSGPTTFIKSVLNRKDGEYIVAYTIKTSSEQEARMIEKAMKIRKSYRNEGI